MRSPPGCRARASPVDDGATVVIVAGRSTTDSWPIDPLPLAAFVVRRHEGRLQLLDVVGGRRALPLAVQAAQALAAQYGVPVLDAWITASHAHWLDPRGEATRSDPEIPVPCNTWTPGPTAAELQGRWFLMAGDADFT